MPGFHICQSKAVLATLALLLSVPICRGSSVVQFVAVNGTVVGGEYVAPYEIKLDGSNFDVTCLDAYRTVYFDDVWNVNVHHIGDAGMDFSSVVDATLRYETAAVLWTWVQDGTISKGEGAFALWNLFRPGFDITPGGPNAMASQTAASQFVMSHPQLNYDNISILTPLNHGTNNDRYQEFMTGRVTSVPEPGTLATMGLGGLLITLGLRARRKKPSETVAEGQAQQVSI